MGQGQRSRWFMSNKDFKERQVGSQPRQFALFSYLQNVASFLTKDLNLDWRLGAEWFESQLVRAFKWSI